MRCHGRWTGAAATTSPAAWPELGQRVLQFLAGLGFTVYGLEPYPASSLGRDIQVQRTLTDTHTHRNFAAMSDFHAGLHGFRI